MRFNANLLGVMTYGLQGPREVFRPGAGPFGDHSLVPDPTIAASISVGSQADLTAEIAALRTAGALPAADGAGTRPDPYRCDTGGDGGGVPDIIGEFNVTPYLADLTWVRFFPTGGGALRFELEVHARWRLIDGFDELLFRRGTAMASVAVDITPTVCDEDVPGATTIPCQTDGALVFEGYRTGLVDPRSAADVAYPHQHLDFAAIATTQRVEANQEFNILACPTLIVALGPLVEALVPGLPGGTLTGPFSGFIVCELRLRAQITRAVAAPGRVQAWMVWTARSRCDLPCRWRAKKRFGPSS